MASAMAEPARRISPSAEAPLTTVLAALEGVQQYGEAYRADCPCGHRSRGTLSVAEGNDGQVLVHCFAGCTFREIAAAAGLSVFSFFPPRPLDTAEQRRVAAKRCREANWAAALRVLADEATVLLALANDLDEGPLDSNSRDRLRLALSRVMAAKEALT